MRCLMTLVMLMPATMLIPAAPAQPPELGQGWLEELNLAGRQMVALAEATPAEKFAWRPREGVRSVSEVYMHVALGSFWLLQQAGGKLPQGTPEISAGLEKKVTAKAEVIAWLKRSLDASRAAYRDTDRTKKVTFFGKETASENVFLRLLVHNHEHMGQSIAYARMIGVVPPWSK